MKCTRCGIESSYWTTSVFNNDFICKACRTKEEKHPLYIRAIEANRVEFKKGNYCFGGIGLPEDLKTYEGNM